MHDKRVGVEFQMSLKPMVWNRIISTAVFYAESRHAVLGTGDCALGRALVS